MASRRLWIGFAIELGLYALLLAVVRPPLPSSPIHAALVLIVTLVATSLIVRSLLIVVSFAFAASVRRDLPPLSLLAWLRMVTMEIRAFLRFAWLIMSGAPGDLAAQARTDTPTSAPLIILLHGILCNAAVWRPVIAELSRRTGCEIRTPSLEPVVAPLDAQVTAFARWLNAAIDPTAPRRIIVVAHSMGGLVMRAYLQRTRDPRFQKLICLGTPHEGSLIARGIRTPIGRDLCPHSAALAGLAASLGATELINIYTEHDNLVVPSRPCTLPRVRNVPRVGCGHMSLIYDPATLDSIVREIIGASS